MTPALRGKKEKYTRLLIPSPQNLTLYIACIGGAGKKLMICSQRLEDFSLFRLETWAPRLT